MAALTAEQRQAVFNLVHAYADFWKSYTGPRGREVPSFTFFDVRGLLERAAEIVVRIRTALAESDRPHTTPTSIDGRAHEYLFSLKRHPKKFADRFVRNLVHSTLRLGAGYADGLTSAGIDTYIEQYDPALTSAAKDSHTQAALRTQFANLTSAWGHACMAMGEILSHGVDAFVQHHTRWDVPKLQRLVSELNSTTHAADTMFGTHGLSTKAHRRHNKRNAAAAAAGAGTAGAGTGPKASASTGREAAGSVEPDSTATEHSEHPPAASDAGEGAVSDDDDSELPAARDVPPFALSVKRVEEDIAAIEDRLMKLESAIDEEGESLAAEPETGRAIVSSLLERCLGFAETLARDTAVIRSLHLRPDLETREMAHLKEATTAVASLAHRLAALGSSLESHADDERRDGAAEPAIRVTGGAQQKSAEEDPESDLNKMSEWFRALKLEPRVDVLEQDDCIVLQMFLPDMRQDDVDVLIGNDRVLVIQGFRRPSPEALLALLRRAPQPLRRATLVQLGAGQFGSFVESFRIPPEIDLAAIEGGYEHSFLRVVLPKSANGPAASAHTLLEHPIADRPAPRRTLYAPRAPGRPVVTADPRTLGLFDVRRGPADDDDGDMELPTGQDFERAEAAEAGPRAGAASAGDAPAAGRPAVPMVRFMDPSTGAVFEMPFAALQASLARASQARRAQAARGAGPHL
eukprot:m.145998 g.145998  ORF g.145998 m.145998 type:complete len:691 (-) comp15034_c0_seq8:21-2093(-)